MLPYIWLDSRHKASTCSYFEQSQNQSLSFISTDTRDFEMGKESSLAVVWVKFYNLPLHYFNEALLYKLGSLLGTVLHIHSSTLALTQQSFAKVCIEIDLAKPFLDTL